MESVELYREPLKVIEGTEAFVEMTENEMAFLCGLIRRFRPRKIVEVGVAAGNTTCVLLECIRMTGLDARLFSVDVRDTYYRDPGKATGYIVEERIAGENRNNHTLYRGKLLPEVIDEIGGGVDMVILDTMHRLPGEILDFLLCLPWLSRNAVIVLHDICFNQIRDLTKHNIREIICTNVLFFAAAGTKFLNEDEQNPVGASNIGAVMVGEDTMKYIDNVFLSLLLNWSYMPEEAELDLYDRAFRQTYSQQQYGLFRKAVALNRNFLR